MENRRGGIEGGGIEGGNRVKLWRVGNRRGGQLFLSEQKIFKKNGGWGRISPSYNVENFLNKTQKKGGII